MNWKTIDTRPTKENTEFLIGEKLKFFDIWSYDIAKIKDGKIVKAWDHLEYDSIFRWTHWSEITSPDGE